MNYLLLFIVLPICELLVFPDLLADDPHLLVDVHEESVLRVRHRRVANHQTAHVDPR